MTGVLALAARYGKLAFLGGILTLALGLIAVRRLLAPPRHTATCSTSTRCGRARPRRAATAQARGLSASPASSERESGAEVGAGAAALAVRDVEAELEHRRDREHAGAVALLPVGVGQPLPSFHTAPRSTKTATPVLATRSGDENGIRSSMDPETMLSPTSLPVRKPRTDDGPPSSHCS